MSADRKFFVMDLTDEERAILNKAVAEAPIWDAEKVRDRLAVKRENIDSAIATLDDLIARRPK